MIVAVDGPSGAGKSSVTKAVAKALGLSLLDTGALYRGVALAASEQGISWEAGREIADLIGRTEFTFQSIEGEEHLMIDGVDGSASIRTPRISEGASRVSALPEVRAALLELQRRLGRQRDCIVEGRDIGTVVFPDAEHKFFLTASNEERVRRRSLQYAAQGKQVSKEELLKEVMERDRRDATRDIAPLVPAVDAVIVDSTGMSFEEVVDQIVRAVRATLIEST